MGLVNAGYLDRWFREMEMKGIFMLTLLTSIEMCLCGARGWHLVDFVSCLRLCEESWGYCKLTLGTSFTFLVR